MSFQPQIPIEQQNGQQLGKILDTLNALNDRLDNMERSTEEMKRGIMQLREAHGRYYRDQELYDFVSAKADDESEEFESEFESEDGNIFN